MKNLRLLAIPVCLCFVSLSAYATEEAMNKALSVWQQRMGEYRSAIKVAKSDEERRAVQLPDETDVAESLWGAISAVTGKRTVSEQPAATRETLDADSDKKGTRARTVPTYEYEEAWAAPGVIWFVNHPEALARLFDKKNRQLSFFAKGLLEAIETVHYAHPRIGEACPALISSPSVQVYEILRKIYLHNKNQFSRGAAAMGMSLMLNNPLIAGRERDEANIKRMHYLRQALILSPEGAMFGDVPIDEIAMEQSYRLKTLSVGAVPPQFKLRHTNGSVGTFPQIGKPTLILFWQPEEEVGVSILSKQSQMEEKYPQISFCPVSESAEESVAQAMQQDSSIKGSYLDDNKRSIAQAYRVQQLPWAILTDERCAIIYNGYPDVNLQAALDRLSTKRREQAKEAGQGKIVICETPDAPAVQPGSRPTSSAQQANDAAPQLREMPQFEQ